MSQGASEAAGADALELLSDFSKARVVVLGDLMLDRFVYGTIDRISPEAPVPVLRQRHLKDMPGGSGNVACNLAALRAGRVTLIAPVGDDDVSGQLRAALARVGGVELRLVPDRSRPTTLKTRYVAEHQQLLRTDLESSLPVDGPIEDGLMAELRAAIAESDLLVLSDYAKGTLTDTVVARAIAMAQQAGIPVIVDPKSRSFSRYRGATILTPNRKELEAATGRECRTDDEVVAAAQPILEAGICDALVVTRGADGLSVIRSGTATHLPTVAKEVFDVSGAGDTVLAALALGIAAGGDIVSSAAVANVAAGIVVSKLGTAVVTPAEVAAALDQYSDKPSEKLFSLARGLQLVQDWHEKGLSVAFTNGCFDLLHPGHVRLLTQARKLADRLVVGLNSDESVRRLKGATRPAQGQLERAAVLASLKAVDAVVIFAEDTPLELIRALEPDVLVKGSDYSVETVVGADLVLGRGGRVELVDLLKGYSTTGTVRRLAATAG